jgi:hypothetical protein
VRRASAAALALAAWGGMSPLHAQGTGFDVFGTLRQTFELDTNYDLEPDSDGNTYQSITRLGLGVLSETATQRLFFSSDFDLRAVQRNDGGSDFTGVDPNLRGRYTQDWYDGGLSTGFFFLQREIEFDRRLSDILADDPDITPPDPDDPDDLGDDGAIDDLIVEDTGRRRDYGADFSVSLRTDSPSSYRIGASAGRTEFSDDAAGDDRTRLNGFIDWSLALAANISTGLSANYSLSSPDDSEELETRDGSVTANLAYAVDETLEYRANLGYASRRTEETVLGQRETERDTGPTGSVGMRYETPRAFFDGTIGLSAAAPEIRPFASILWRYDLPRGGLSADANQNYTFDRDGNEISRTTLGAGWRHDIDTLSRLRFGLRFDRQSDPDDRGEDRIRRYTFTSNYNRDLTPLSSATVGLDLAYQDEEDDDIRRANITAAYSRDFTPDVSGNLGYRLRLRDDEDGSATSHVLFFSIGRAFGGTP